MGRFLSKQLWPAFPSLMLPALLAGCITGIVGVAAFGIIHAYIIEPIWRSLLAGLFGAFLPVYVICGISLILTLSQILKVREQRRQNPVNT